MLKRVAILICAALLSVPAAHAAQPAQVKPAAPEKQTPKPDAKGEQAPPKPAPEPAPLPVNVKIEVSINDQTADGPPSKKVVTMIVGDRQRNSIRSSARVPERQQMAPGAPASYQYRDVTINVDVHPAIVPKESNKVLVSLGLQYFPKSAGGRDEKEVEPGMASLNEQLSLILESGKPTIVSQAADPASDRKITVELTATILK